MRIDVLRGLCRGALLDGEMLCETRRTITVGADGEPAGKAFAELVELMRRLRAPAGCPWDRQQDAESLRRYVLEEAYEVVQAIEDGEQEALCSELGDLLLQIVFLAEIGREKGDFEIVSVITGIHDKLVRRHPHVFGDVAVEDAAEVLSNWEAIKRGERGGGSLLDDVPDSLPALARAEKLGRRRPKCRLTGLTPPP